eukprot:m.49597 g.49597  ORF g.49597 m.49597 type:complete len:62 (+) comp15331_c0_seq3:1515-1700(+)
MSSQFLTFFLPAVPSHRRTQQAPVDGILAARQKHLHIISKKCAALAYNWEHDDCIISALIA